ncbi:MAG: acylphosphatase [Chloroflexi bacterium]|nr:acylphosphatase [Chloroflexota bacterium]
MTPSTGIGRNERPGAELASLHIWVSGRVQGVFYRDSIRHEAIKHGIKGWVKNLPDGKVEAVLEGQRQALEEVARWAWHGPPTAVVREVKLEWEAYSGQYRNFSVL